MDASDAGTDLDHVLFTEAQIHDRLQELGDRIWADYKDKDLLLVGVLKGAVLVMADLMRTLPGPRRWTGWRCRRTDRAPSPPASYGS